MTKIVFVRDTREDIQNMVCGACSFKCGVMSMLVAKDICPAVVLVVSFLCEAVWLLVVRLCFVLFVALLLLSLVDPA